MKHIALFAGIAGDTLAAQWAGFETVLFVENDKFCQKVLKKHWPGVPLHQDIFDLSIWELGKNDGICYNKLCGAKTKEQQIQQTYNWLMMPREVGELVKSVSLAAQWCPYLQALQTEVGNTVLGNVVSRPCAERTEQMPMVGLGCEVPTTPTGKMEQDTKGISDTKKQKSPNGEEGCSQETIIPVNSANSDQSERITYVHTTSNLGQSIQKSDSKYLMELLYAKYATTKCTRTAQRVDLLSAGTPCQPASVAGKQLGSSDDRWLWPETYRIIRELQSKWIVLENVKGLLALEGGVAFNNLLLDLESSGYESQTFLIPACAVNAPHRRDRIFIVANAGHYDRADLEITRDDGQATTNNSEGEEGSIQSERPGSSQRRNQDVADSESKRRERGKWPQPKRTRWSIPNRSSKNVSNSQAVRTQGGRTTGEQEPEAHEGQEISLCGSPGRGANQRAVKPELGGVVDGLSQWMDEPDIPRVAKGIKNRVDRLKVACCEMLKIVTKMLQDKCYKITNSEY